MGGCFVALFLFFLFFGSRGGGGSSSSSTNPSSSGGAGGGGTQAAGGGKAMAAGRPGAEPPVITTYRVVRELPHDPAAFLQGLQFDRRCEGGGKARKCRDVFWESTGLNGRSTLREVDLESGRVLRSKALPKMDFGEGVARHGDKLYQLTWQRSKTWRYSVDDFEAVEEVATPLRDGWGVTSDGANLIVSDSSEVLTWVDPVTMLKVRDVTVTDDGRPVAWVNELEWIEGLIWGNVWQTDCVAQIDPADGRVVGWLRLAGLRDRALAASAADGGGGASLDGGAQPEVVNGVAYDPQQGRLFVSGKLWPRIYQIETEEVPASSGPEGAKEALAAARRDCIVSGAGGAGFGRRRRR